jgi:protein-tyrosine-phosphatase
MALRSILDNYAGQRVTEFDRIPEERKSQLENLARYIRERIATGQPARLTFICTHNSRRSHMSQLWTQVAAAYYGVAGVETYSGGTEATAFNPRAVAALQRAGFEVREAGDGPNPIYEVRFDDSSPALTAFSKVYDEAPNPGEEFCAVMTCAEADEGCPVVLGAALRVSIPYEDPKAFDGADREAEAYDKRCSQIGREMFYLISQARI